MSATNDDSSISVDKRRELKEAEAGEKKLPYPRSIWFIVGNEFCERFSYYGMRAILSIYIKSKLHFSEDTSTVIYHTFALFCYFTPIFGALLADQILGKFRTILYISLIYVLGHVLKTLAAVPTLSVPPVEFSLIGLALIAIGTGGIKPCVSAFGGDQFKLPEQERQLQTFFSIFYFAINSGSLISTFLTPVLREDVKCFGDDTCYSLAFGIPALLMLVATVILYIGKNMYVMKPPQGNILTKVVGATCYAGKKRLTSSEKRDHWLDHALDVYPRDLVEDVKLLFRVLLIYVPLPVFWALFDQQGSRWTFQATRMNGAIGSWIIKPDQMQLINPALILILIPLFDGVIYPFFAKLNLLVKPLQRITVGGLLTAAAFFISGFLELELMKTYDRIPGLDESHIHVMNSLGCPLNVRLSTSDGAFNEHSEIALGGNTIFYDLRPGLYDIDVRIEEGCNAVVEKMKRYQIEAKDEKVSGIVVRGTSEKNIEITNLAQFEEPKKFSNGNSKVRVVFESGFGSQNQTLMLRPFGSESLEDGYILLVGGASKNGVQESEYMKVPPDHYDFYYGNAKIGDKYLAQGGVHTFYVSGNSELGYEPVMNDFLLTSENSVHMLWLVPQYVVITTGEIMFSVTGLEFSYSQAPASMKSVLQAAWLLTVAFGNLIVIVIAEARAFEDQASEFFMFAILMVLDMILFAVIAYFYTYVDVGRIERERSSRDLHVNINENNNTDMVLAERKKPTGIDNPGYSDSTDF